MSTDPLDETGDKKITYKKVQNGTKTTDMYLADNLLHRENGPAWVVYENNVKREEIYYIHGMIHRMCLPAIITYHNDGTINSQEWFMYGKRSRFNDEPTVTYQYANGTFKEKNWHDHSGQLDRCSNLPAVVSYYEDGTCRCIIITNMEKSIVIMLHH